MKYSVQQIEEALKGGKIISFDNSWHKKLYHAKISEGSVLVFWGMANKVGYSLGDFLNNFHDNGWICTKIEGEENMEKKTPHKHAELIKLWAEGVIIQYKGSTSEVWSDCDNNDPLWSEYVNYRVKPTLVKKWKWVYRDLCGVLDVTDYCYTEQEFNSNFQNLTLIQKVDSTMIEVEE